MQMGLGLLAGCRDGEIILDHAGGSNVITWVPIMKEGEIELEREIIREERLRVATVSFQHRKQP